MLKPRILVTSAAGHTGTPVALQLLARGFPVRAFVRQQDERSKLLQKAGAEIFVGNLFDFRDLQHAMVGVKRAYHCPPFGDNLLQNTMLFALAAEDAKLEVVALMSQWNPHPTHPSNITREHWLTNQIYRWMPSVDVIHINPGLFAFTYMLGLPAIAHFGMLMAPFGNGRNAPPSNEDIAHVVSEVLHNPSKHIGKSYRPTGPKLLSSFEIADILGKVLNRRVIYKNIPFKNFSKAALALGFPISELAHLRHYADELKGGAFEIGGVTDHVLEVTGTAPETFETTAKRYMQQPHLISKDLKFGTKTQAFRFLAKMILTPPADLIKWESEKGYPKLKAPLLAHQSAEWRTTASRQELNLLFNT